MYKIPIFSPSSTELVPVRCLIRTYLYFCKAVMYEKYGYPYLPPEIRKIIFDYIMIPMCPHTSVFGCCATPLRKCCICRSNEYENSITGVRKFGLKLLREKPPFKMCYECFKTKRLNDEAQRENERKEIQKWYDLEEEERQKNYKIKYRL